MKKQNAMKRFLWTIAVLSLLTSSAAFAQRDRIEKSFNVSPGGTLTIETDKGSIDVETSNSDRVEIEVIREVDGWNADELLDEFTVDFKQRGDDVIVTGEFEGERSRRGWWGGKYRKLKIHYNVVVPRRYNVDLKTSGGGIEVDDLEGEVYCKTSGGSLTFGNVTGDVEGQTSGGSITVGEVDGQVDVHTSGGSIRIDRAKGDVRAKTSGGSISVNEVYGSIDARTSGGSVSAEISEQPKDDCRLTTSGGNVTVYLSDKVGVNVDARTSGGRVRTDFPVMVRGEISKRSLVAKVNGGGPELYLRTSGGSISLKER